MPARYETCRAPMRTLLRLVVVAGLRGVDDGGRGLGGAQRLAALIAEQRDALQMALRLFLQHTSLLDQSVRAGLHR